MVESDSDPIINSEASQTVFEGSQKLLQPPPEEPKKKGKRNPLLVVGLTTVGLLLMVVVLGAAYSQSNRIQTPDSKVTASPSPTPIFIDQAKETELQRIETVVKAVDPEALLVMPPQVDMAVQF